MKKFNHFLQYVFIYIFFLIFKILGFKKSSNLGNIIGKYLGPIFRSKKSIITNLEKAGINKNQDIIASNVLGNYGRILAEYVHLKNFKNNKLNKYISIEGVEHFESIKKTKKPVVFISGHFNNFELMAMQIENSGIECAALYRPLNNPFLNKLMEKIRIRDICKTQIRKGRAGTREIIKNLKDGKSIALMIDQRVREGEKVNFFGNLATTTTIPAQLIKKYNCDVVPIYIERNNNNYFKMYVSQPIKIKKTKSIKEITLFLNVVLEKMILKNVDQWIWSHDRWKK
ncbi:lysophospholipid acyltransferase family protein [Candidatus Pelagibacter sp. HIMB1695]|uniref:lysophospholipid acyltransferase family protein n=1 Tax=Candidatus Pelagibacter sp. HIMB1695 TaxID=3413364 RepID=UPI003F85C095